ncbi:MAG TPA: hypothetical protein VGH45_05780 [Solirubrobacteraceae bacterium]
MSSGSGSGSVSGPGSGSGALDRPVYDGEGYKPFKDFTVADARGRAAELSSVTGWGPTARVGAVARGWSELAREMAAAGAERVADLDVEAAEGFARKLWVVPPGGSLL